MKSIEQILVEGLLATAPEEIQAPTYQLISDLKSLLSKYPRPAAILAMMKVHMDMADGAKAELEKMLKP